jgi:diguanylate cyclase (GGDEF)-like protein
VLPRGRGLPGDVWSRRHRAIVLLLWGHVAGIAAFGLLIGAGVVHSLFEAAVVAAPGVLAAWDRPRRAVRASFASLGLLTASGVLVHLSGGYIELHFHFFVMVGVMALYQHWAPFLLAVGYVVLHHGIAGVVAPESVYNHPDAIAHPWRWAGIHGAFLTAAAIASLTAWRLNEHQSLHDPLTGLPNRLLLADRLSHTLVSRERREESLAVLFLDLDNFKAVNDTVGHGAADRALVDVAGRLRDQLRPVDTVARLGGDEFAILVDGTADAAEAIHVAERLVRAVRKPLWAGGRRFSLTASVGIAVNGAGLDEAEELLHSADVAMYAAKARGKDRLELFEPEMHAAAVRRLELEAELGHAVESGELVVHYQPIASLASGRIVGMEALVRWAHPTRGLVPPGEFVAIAEEMGLIGSIGRFVLESACRQACSWEARFGSARLWTMSVNLSARQLEDAGLADDVARVLSDTGFDARRLILEVTESALPGETDAALARLSALKALGVKLAIDDFGAGYSSLGYLRRFPIDILKLDRSLVHELESDNRNFELTRAVVALGSILRLSTVAEGIERAEQLARLRLTRCDLVQGFLVSRPLDPDAMDEFLAAAAATEVVRQAA